jgi:hypothetical protein
MPRVIQVIESTINRGIGIEPDPVRNVTQYHTLDGVLLAENDPCRNWAKNKPEKEDKI